MQPDPLPLLPPGLPLLPPNLPLLSLVGGGRRRVDCGGEKEVESEREAGREREREGESESGDGDGELGVSWIGWVGKLGVSEGKRETGE